MPVEKYSWEAAAAAKRASTRSKIPRDWLLDKSALEEASKERNITGPFIEKHLTSEEKALTQLSAPSLLSKIQDGTYNALQVTQAYCKRSAIAQQFVCCLYHFLNLEVIVIVL